MRRSDHGPEAEFWHGTLVPRGWSAARKFTRLFQQTNGQQSLDVTLAYLKGKDAESEEAQEHANGSSLAVYARL